MKKRKFFGQTKYTFNAKNVTVTLDLKRFEKQFQLAQYGLDSMVMESMEPFMPMQDGGFINLTHKKSQAVAGSGQVYAAAGPFGRFQYEGKTMVDVKTGSPWARSKAKKVLVSQYGGKTNAKPNLSYSRTGAKAHWFDAAKSKDLDVWVKKTKETAGGG